MSKVTTVGDRVELKKNHIITYGFVRFIGSILNKRGIFYGIELDEAKGRNNGSFGNLEYFRCDMNHGLFVKKSFIARTLKYYNENTPRVTVGDKVYVMNRNCNGIIKYIGTPYSIDNIYYGIQLDRRIGNTNGTVNKRWCFTCEDNYGIFVQCDEFNVLCSTNKGEGKTADADWRELLVIGFIRTYQMFIPSGVFNIIYSYQYESEIWCRKWTSEGISINDSDVEITIISAQQPTAFGNESICAGVFKWRIKIKEFVTNKYKVSPFIGIIEDKERYLKHYVNSAFWNRSGYQYCGGNGLVCGMDNYSAVCNFRFNKVNDILQLILDLNNLTIQIMINGVDYGIVFRNIKKTSYRLALAVSACHGAKFVLL